RTPMRSTSSWWRGARSRTSPCATSEAGSRSRRSRTPSAASPVSSRTRTSRRPTSVDRNPAMRIRLATAEDLPALKALIPLSARALSRGYYSEEQTEGAIRHVFGPDSRLIADGTYFAAEQDDELAGCGGWSRRRTLFGGDQ